MHKSMVPVGVLRGRVGLSERALAEAATMARNSLRSLERGENATLSLYARAARALDRTIVIAMLPDEACDSSASTVAVAARVIADGRSSWRVHFMELVDAFRRTLDPRLVLLPPPPGLSPELHALLASIVLELARSSGIDPPDWACQRCFLPRPFFPAATEALKASALVEAPLAFRRNNIFVLANFLDRA